MTTQDFEHDKATVNQLLAGTTDFAQIYVACPNLNSPAKATSDPNAGPLLVLDASFNPPHNAHAALFHTALQQYPEAGSALLLMSTRNADKPGVVSDQYAHRLGMLRRFADVCAGLAAGVEGSQMQRVAVCLTTHARFVDKFNQLDAAAAGQAHAQAQGKEVVFLAGFDTLVRILDPKYYSGVPLSQALGGRFQSCVRFMVLARMSDESADMAAVVGGAGGWAEQAQYVARIAAGDLPGVPALWARRIDIVQATAESLGISSTGVRRAAVAGEKETLEAMVPKPVALYIYENKVYT